MAGRLTHAVSAMLRVLAPSKPLMANSSSAASRIRRRASSPRGWYGGRRRVTLVDIAVSRCKRAGAISVDRQSQSIDIFSRHHVGEIIDGGFPIAFRVPAAASY